MPDTAWLAAAKEAAAADNTAWVAFGSALAGALVGGFASAAGSLIVARLRARFDARTALYLDLVADFRSSRRRDARGAGPFPHGLLESMHRTAVLAGRKERRMVVALKAAYARRLEQPADDDPRWEQKIDPVTGKPRPGRTINRDREDAAVEAALVALEKHLEKKLG